MRSPPSFQIPAIQATPDTICSTNIPPDHNPAAESGLPSKSLATKPRHDQIDSTVEPASKKQRTSKPVETRPNVDKPTSELSTTLLSLRNDYKSKALTLSETQTQALLTTLSDLGSSHQDRVSTLAAMSKNVLEHDIADTMLDFKDATGQEKGSVTLGGRMSFFDERVQEIRVSVEELLSERQDVEHQIADVGRELTDLLADGALERVMDKGEECKKLINGTVDAAIAEWQEQECTYERKKALHSEYLQKMCADLEE